MNKNKEPDETGGEGKPQDKQREFAVKLRGGGGCTESKGEGQGTRRVVAQKVPGAVKEPNKRRGERTKGRAERRFANAGTGWHGVALSGRRGNKKKNRAAEKGSRLALKKKLERE